MYSFLDLRKAFDSLDHVVLLVRLCALGVHDIELTWFANYLSHRMQHVRHRDSIILLFLVFINEMPSLVTHSRLLQFADDTTLICSGETHEAARE